MDTKNVDKNVDTGMKKDYRHTEGKEVRVSSMKENKSIYRTLEDNILNSDMSEDEKKIRLACLRSLLREY